MYILDASANTPLFSCTVFTTEDILLRQRRRVEGAYKEVVCSIWADMSITVSDNYIAAAAAAIDRTTAARRWHSALFIRVMSHYPGLSRSSLTRSPPHRSPVVDNGFQLETDFHRVRAAVYRVRNKTRSDAVYF